MIKCFYDLHIHSTLSPCASNDMTLHNIVNMACLKGLDIISLTDHNSAKNVEAIMDYARTKSLIVIPGIEVETYEGIHMLCYFKSCEDIKLFNKIIYQKIPRVQNNEQLLGEQLILDKNDCVVCKEVKMLLNSTCVKLNELTNLVHLMNGLVFTAHIDRKTNSIITILGFIPENLAIDGIEISHNAKLIEYQKETFSKYRIIQNSDAHYIGNICEKINYLKLKEKSIEAFFDYFGGVT